MSSDYLESLFGLTSKVAVITGGSGVLCREMGRALACAGARVVLLARHQPPLQAVVDDIAAHGGQALALPADVLDTTSLEIARATVLERFGHADILINGAGGNQEQATTSPDLSFFDLPPDAVQEVFNLNFLGTLLASQVFGRAMADAGEGVILNVSSMNAFRPLTRVPAYSAAKAAVSNFTRWLAVHLAQEYSPRIRVNALAPGFFLTAQNRFLLMDEATGELTPRGQTIIDHTPMGRFGEPADLIGATLWLLSPAASFVTGIVVPVDGGFSAYSGV